MPHVIDVAMKCYEGVFLSESIRIINYSRIKKKVRKNKTISRVLLVAWSIATMFIIVLFDIDLGKGEGNC